MAEKKDSTIKAYDHYCMNEACNNNWVSKNEDNFCPDCGCTILEIEKLRR